MNNGICFYLNHGQDFNSRLSEQVLKLFACQKIILMLQVYQLPFGKSVNQYNCFVLKKWSPKWFCFCNSPERSPKLLANLDELRRKTLHPSPAEDVAAEGEEQLVLRLEDSDDGNVSDGKYFRLKVFSRKLA